MKPNLTIQIVLVALSLILLLVAVFMPPKTREVPTTISIELEGERVVLQGVTGMGSSNPRDRQSSPAARIGGSADQADTDNEGIDPESIRSGIETLYN